jgi:hypothetical protein
MSIHPEVREFTLEQITNDPVLRYFHYSHLPPVLQAASKPFCDVAEFIVLSLPRNPERSVALRKLLEAKDAAVRANIPGPEPIAAMMADDKIEGRWGSDEVLAQISGEALDKAAYGQFVPEELKEAYFGEKSAAVDGIEGLPETVEIDENPDEYAQAKRNREVSEAAQRLKGRLDKHVADDRPRDDTETKAFGAIGSVDGFEDFKKAID